MITKYKVSEVAKDFGLQNKDVTDILGKYFDDAKKSSTALDSKELDVLFDVLTQENSVENFDAYFAMQKKEEKKPEPKKAEAKKEAPKKDAPKKDAPKKEQAEKHAKKADNKKADKKAEESKAEKKHGESSLNPFKKHEKKNDGPMQSRTKGEKRTIDTRADNVELEKYNEKYVTYW